MIGIPLSLKRYYLITVRSLVPGTANKSMDIPFERMLAELGIRHRYCKPYRPQTNGKVERFWRTLQEDLIRETDFDTLAELKDELMQYLYYYNHHRPQQGIEGKVPADMVTVVDDSAKALSTNGETDGNKIEV